jgi:hypothetical protein
MAQGEKDDRGRDLFDRRRVMGLIGGMGVGTIGATSLVQAIAGPATAAPGPLAGAFDSQLRAMYRAYGRGRWAALRRLLDPRVVLTVPEPFPFPGTYGNSDEVLSYFQKTVEAGWGVVLDGVGGFLSYSIGVHDAVSPSAERCQAAFIARFTSEGIADELNLFGFTPMK